MQKVKFFWGKLPLTGVGLFSSNISDVADLEVEIAEFLKQPSIELINMKFQQEGGLISVMVIYKEK